MKYVLAILLIMFFVNPAHAIDKKIGATNIFKIGIFDTSSKSNGVAGLTYTTDVVIKIQCATAGVTTVNGTGDTFTSEGGGYYYLSTNDAITNTNEDECIAWAEGAGNYTGYIAKTPIKFKAIDLGTYIVSGVEDTGNISTTTQVYTSLADGTGKYINMCLYSASNTRRSKILSVGANFFTVRGFTVAPTNGSSLEVFEGGCQ